MKRNHWLGLLILLLLVGNIIWHVWGSWGLVTIHAENRPLSEVIRSIEKQGGVTVKTDLDATTPVRMHVDKVKVTEALETLSVLTESRWRLTYFVAADKGAIGGALGSLAAGQRAEGWRMLFLPVPSMGAEPVVPADPRRDTWEVKPSQEATLQAYLKQAAQSVSASFLVPENWNPEIKSAPSSGPITKSLPKLVSAANGKYEEVFLLQRGFRFGRGDGAEDGDGPRFASFDGGGGGGERRGGGRGFDREAFEARIEAEINKLPPAERAAAKKEREEWKEIRELPPEQREARIQEKMNSPQFEERMEQGQASRDARRSPQQKIERAKKYLDRKEQIKSGAAPSGGGGAGGGGRGPRP